MATDDQDKAIREIAERHRPAFEAWYRSKWPDKFIEWNELEARYYYAGFAQSCFESWCEACEWQREQDAKEAESHKAMIFGPHGPVWVESEAGQEIAEAIRRGGQNG